MKYIDILREVAEKNIVVSVVILIVLFARLLLKRAPKIYSYVLWFAVGFRMMFDVAFQTKFNFMNIVKNLLNHKSETAVSVADTYSNSENVIRVSEQYGNTVAPANTTKSVAESVNTQISDKFVDAANRLRGNSKESPNRYRILSDREVMNFLVVIACIVLVVWLTGIVVILAVQLISYIHLGKITNQAVLMKDNIWECDFISSPFVFGLIRPRIYLPFHLSVEERNYLIAHESYHIKRRDYLVKTVFFLLVTLYWMNPLVWIAFRMMTRDMEMSCDEAVIRTYGSEIKKIYSSMILNFATKSSVQCSYVAFGEGDAGMRIKNILKFKKLSKGMTVVVVTGVVACVGVLMSFNFDVKAKETKNEQSIGKQVSDTTIGKSQSVEQERADISIPKMNKTVNISPDNFTDTQLEKYGEYSDEEVYDIRDTEDRYKVYTQDEWDKVVKKGVSYDELPRYQMGDEVSIAGTDKVTVVVKDAYVADCVEGVPKEYAPLTFLDENGEPDEFGYLIVMNVSIQNDDSKTNIYAISDLNITDRDFREQRQGEGNFIGGPIRYPSEPIFTGSYSRMNESSYYSIILEPNETYEANIVMYVDREAYGKNLDLLVFPEEIYNNDELTYQSGAVIHLDVDGNS